MRKKAFTLFGTLAETSSIDGVVMNVKFNQDKHTKNYYGNDFSDFFIKLKTNTMGLTSLEAVGSFYESLNERVLKKYGYEKAEAV